MTKQDSGAAAAVYVQTNDATKNEVLVFERSAEGRLAPLGRFDTGGRGTGGPHPTVAELDRPHRGRPAAPGRQRRQRRPVAVRRR